MSSSTRVKSTLKVPNFASVVDQSAVQDAEQLVVRGQIKPLIASGTSPVRNHGRFPAYSNSDKYPADKKPKRPVNLSLSGDMLREYGAQQGNGGASLFVGIVDSASESIKNRAIGNNYGTSGAPARRIVPAPGEQFKVSVIQALREVFARAIERRLRRR